jgi:hypothetical protein
MMRTSLLLTLGLSLVGASIEAAEVPKELAFGLQVGVAIPTGNDLGTTTRSGLNPSLGFHATWRIDDDQSLRPRMDLWTFGAGQQEVSVPLMQRIDTKVQGIALGADYVHHFVNRRNRWSAGVGVYAIRWSVKSTNQLTFPDGATVQASGTSSWIRPGVGLLGCCKLTPHLQVEIRWIASRYGYEELPANLGTVGLLWHF